MPKQTGIIHIYYDKKEQFPIKGALSNFSLFVIYPVVPGAEPGALRTPDRSSAAKPDSYHSK